MRRLLLPVAATVTLAFPALPAPAGGSGPPVPVAVLEGRGFGHGVGMAQDGAYWMGRGGSTTAQILNHFYPGTKMGRAGGEVRVAVLSSPNGEVVVGFPSGGEIRDARDGGQSPGFPVRLGAGSQARLRFDGRAYTVEIMGGGRRASLSGRQVALASSSQPLPGATTTTSTLPLIGGPGTVPTPTTPTSTPLPPPSVAPPTAPTTAPPAPPATTSRPTSGRALWAVPAGGGTISVPARSQQYRGVVQATAAGGALRLVNHVDVEQYLRGMGEVRDARWPAASLGAQAIAARTYALRAVGGGGELCDTQRCQVYLGTGAEYGAMDKAVSRTRGQVVMAGRGLAATVYSANGGGSSAATEEGFGTPGAGYPYLRPAPYPTQDPFGWTVRVSLRDLGGRLGYGGTVTGVRVTSAGPSGRALQVTLDGSRGARSYAGLEFRRALSLRSTLFTARAETAEAPPPPPPPPDGGPAVQALPDQAGDAGAAVTASAPDPAVPAEAAAPRPAGTLGEADAAAAIAHRRPALAAVAWLLLVAVVGGLTTNRLGRRAPTPR